MMDLNEVPSDLIVNTMESDVKKLAKSDGKFEGKMEDSRSKCSEVAEQKCSRVVEEKCLALELEIRKNSMELDAIRVRVRGLEGERAAIEEEIEVLKKKKAALQGLGVEDEKMSRVELSLDDLDMKCAEGSKLDQLMIENKVLECEKMSALREVKDWKQKCSELESQVVKLEGRLSCQGADATMNAMGEAPFNGDVNAFADLGSSHSRVARDGEVQMQVMSGTPCLETPEKRHLHVEGSQNGRMKHGTRVRRQLVFQNEGSCDRKIAPSTPEGAINIIDSGDERHSPDKHKPSFQIGTPCVTKSVNADETVDFLDLEDATDCRESILSMPTPKRKRGPKVVFSDDECEDDEAIPTKRAFKIDNNENKGEEDDDSMPIKQVVNRNNGNCKGDDDEDDKIPISQLKLNRAQHSSQPIARRTRSSSRSQARNFTQSQTHSRRRLVKSQQGVERGRAEESEDNPEMVTENVEDTDSEEDGSDSEADSLKSFIDDASDIEEVQDDVEEDGTEHSSEPEDASDSNLDYSEIISRLQRRKGPNSKWALEGEMLSDFGKDPELCMRAVCALYRQQTADEKRCKESIFQNGRGFSKFHASRGTKLGEFLTDGDPYGDLVKSVKDLKEYDPDGVEACRRLAKHYSKQLFEIYKKNEDPFFPGSL